MKKAAAKAKNDRPGRWMRAQRYERTWWEEKCPDIDLEFYRSYAERVLCSYGRT